MNDEFQELSEALDLETWLQNEGVSFRAVQGSRGRQFNCLECPVCGKRDWKVYLHAETGLGNCFSGSCEQKFNKLTYNNNS